MSKINNFTKQPSETFTISIDFSTVLDGETISTISVVAYNNTEVVTSTIIDSSSKDDDTVYIKVKAGTSGLDYKITVVVTTSNSNIFEEDIIMQVREK